MIGSIVGGAMQIGGAIFGGIAGARAARKARQNVEKRMRENQDWYDRNYNENATQRADAQHLINMTEERIKQRNRGAAGTAAVMGGGAEAAAIEKAGNSQALANMASQINADAADRKDRIEAQYMSRKDDLNQQLEDIEQQKRANIASAVQGVMGAGAGIAGAAIGGTTRGDIGRMAAEQRRNPDMSGIESMTRRGL